MANRLGRTGASGGQTDARRSEVIDRNANHFRNYRQVKFALVAEERMTVRQPVRHGYGMKRVSDESDEGFVGTDRHLHQHRWKASCTYLPVG